MTTASGHSREGWKRTLRSGKRRGASGQYRNRLCPMRTPTRARLLQIGGTLTTAVLPRTRRKSTPRESSRTVRTATPGETGGIQAGVEGTAPWASPVLADESFLPFIHYILRKAWRYQQPRPALFPCAKVLPLV